MSSEAVTRVYVVRHGETDWNAQGRIQGHTDIPLNDRGRAQARAAAKHLSQCGLDAVFSSDLQRAVETSDIIRSACPTLPTVSRHPELRERDFGPISGRLIAEASKLRDSSVKSEADPTEWSGVPGVESDGKMADRVWSFVRPAVEAHAGKTVLLVTHGGVLRVMMYRVLEIDFGRPWRCVLANAAINLFEVRGGIWRLRVFGQEAGG